MLVSSYNLTTKTAVTAGPMHLKNYVGSLGVSFMKIGDGFHLAWNDSLFEISCFFSIKTSNTNSRNNFFWCKTAMIGKICKTDLTKNLMSKSNEFANLNFGRLTVVLRALRAQSWAEMGEIRRESR